MTGDKEIGKLLPEKLELTHIYINAGLSAQALLNGRKEVTYESLYMSRKIELTHNKYEQMELCFA